ncbi:MAG TPA: tail fiber protein [Rhizomicrobium sp.]|jgi:microcystin-dependent protein
MSDPFVAEIRIFPFNFAPKGWAFCDGQLLPLSQNTALFSLLGTTYGGDGKSNFALPNYQGRVPMFWGQGAGLSLYDIGQASGEDYVSLLPTEIPSHNHSMSATTAVGTAAVASSNALAEGKWDDGQGHSGAVQYYTQVAADTVTSPLSTSFTGGGLPHNNLMPYLTLNFCIALQGIFPPRG